MRFSFWQPYIQINALALCLSIGEEALLNHNSRSGVPIGPLDLASKVTKSGVESGPRTASWEVMFSSPGERVETTTKFDPEAVIFDQLRMPG